MEKFVTWFYGINAPTGALPQPHWELSIPSSSTCIKWYWVLCFSLQLCFISNVYSVPNFWRTGNQNTDSWSYETDKNFASKPTVYKKAALSQGNFARCRCNFPDGAGCHTGFDRIGNPTSETLERNTKWIGDPLRRWPFEIQRIKRVH